MRQGAAGMTTNIVRNLCLCCNRKETSLEAAHPGKRALRGRVHAALRRARFRASRHVGHGAVRYCQVRRAKHVAPLASRGTCQNGLLPAIPVRLAGMRQPPDLAPTPQLYARAIWALAASLSQQDRLGVADQFASLLKRSTVTMIRTHAIGPAENASIRSLLAGKGN